MLRAAFMSRSWTHPQLAHVHIRSASIRSPFFHPHAEHSFDEANQRPTFWTSEPRSPDLYSSCRTASPTPASANDLERRVLASAFRSRSSTQMTAKSVAKVLVNL